MKYLDSVNVCLQRDEIKFSEVRALLDIFMELYESASLIIASSSEIIELMIFYSYIVKVRRKRVLGMDGYELAAVSSLRTMVAGSPRFEIESGVSFAKRASKLHSHDLSDLSSILTT